MYIYIIGSILAIFFAWLTRHSVQFKKKENVCVIISAIPLFVLAAFRYGIGTDYYTYIEMYNWYFTKGIRAGIEPIFYYLNRIIGWFNGDAQWIFVICSAIYILCIFKSIFKSSKNIYLSIFFLISMTYYVSFYNTMRQHVACALCLLALTFLENKNYKVFIILVLIATGFHYSTIIFLTVLILSKLEIKPIYAIGLTGVFFVLSRLIAIVLNSMLLGTRYSKYISMTNEESVNSASYFGIMVQIAILILASIYYRQNQKYKVYYNIQIIATWMTILGTSVGLISRAKWVFSLPAIILLPMVINGILDKKQKGIITLLTVICFCIYFYVVVYISKSYGVLPYKSIFSK